MLRFQRITTADTSLYAFMEQLLTASFPTEEYRDLNELRAYTDGKPQFTNNVIMDDDTPIGLITYWDFDTFYYAEHLAVDPERRNGGYGAKTMQHLCSLLTKPIVLEVEMPDTEMARRRIGFYRRQGFELWDKATYLQPPYRPGDEPLPMYLMVHGDLVCERDFETVRDRIHREVYNVK